MPGGKINQPSNQIKLTNVSLVRLKKGKSSLPAVITTKTPYSNPFFPHPGKKRYEVACYKNKVLEYRTGAETDLDNVLQIPSVFLSVSKGQLAPTADLKKSFGANTSQEDIILEILKKGELQVGEKERKSELERLEKEVLEIVAGKVVDPRSGRVYTTGMIEKALEVLSSKGGHSEDSAAASGTTTPTTNGGASKDSPAPSKPRPTWTGVVTTKSAKSQALDAMKALIAWQPIPIMRARMRLRVTCPTAQLKQAAKSKSAGEAAAEGGETKGTVKDRILSYVEQVEAQDTLGAEWEVTGFVEPGAFKGLSEFIGAETRGRGRVEVLDMAVTHED
ncbi:MAG: hypothetical protein M1834_005978 [Cirrosporium novae-zelandiae]|nr:MAG: hypothetical protein M1834_005978 [Cirrosporium novae-zelandiae]